MRAKKRKRGGSRRVHTYPTPGCVAARREDSGSYPAERIGAGTAEQGVLVITKSERNLSWSVRETEKERDVALMRGLGGCQGGVA